MFCDGFLKEWLWLIDIDFIPEKATEHLVVKVLILLTKLFSLTFMPLKLLSDFVFNFFQFCSINMAESLRSAQYSAILRGNRKQIIVSSSYLADILVHLDWIPRLDYWSGRAWQGDRELTVSKTPSISGPASCPFPDLDCLPEPASRLLILPGWFVLDIALIYLVPLNSMEHW